MLGTGMLILMMLILWEWHLENIGSDGLFKLSLFQPPPGLISGFSVRFIQLATMASCFLPH